MKIAKRISCMALALLMVVLSSVLFVGCKDDKEYEDLFVFTTQGGKVYVNTVDEITFGDGGKKFTFEENAEVELKAVADVGYMFVKWEYTSLLSDELETQSEIKIALNDELVIRAVFAINTADRLDVLYTANGDGYSIVPEPGYQTSVLAGSAFKFKVNLDEEYSNSSIIVKVNGSIINAVGGVYTISNIQEDITITVDGVEKNKYSVNWLYSDNYTIKANEGYANSVVYGNEFKFTVTVNGEYDGYLVKCNGIILDAQEGVYGIYNITSNCVISVDLGAETPNQYTISYSGEGYAIASSTHSNLKVYEGEKFEFKIDVLDGYVAGDISVSASGGVLVKKGANNKYYIENVNQDITLTVSGIVKLENKTFTFNLGARDEDIGLWEVIEDMFPGFSILSIDKNTAETIELYDLWLNVQGRSENFVDYVDSINEELQNLFSEKRVVKFTCNGKDFITFNDTHITINWNELISGEYTHDIVIVLE